MSTEEKEPMTAPLIPNWRAASHIYVMAIEAGTREGKRAGKEGVIEMAEALDKQNVRIRRLVRELQKFMGVDEIEALLESTDG